MVMLTPPTDIETASVAAPVPRPGASVSAARNAGWSIASDTRGHWPVPPEGHRDGAMCRYARHTTANDAWDHAVRLHAMWRY